MLVVPFTLTAPPEHLPQGVTSLNIRITASNSDDVDVTKSIKFLCGLAVYSLHNSAKRKA